VQLQIGEALPALIPLIKDFHERSKIPYSFAQTLKQLYAVPLNPTHEFVVAVHEDGSYQGYLWAEVLENRDFWLHQVYAPKDDLSSVFLEYSDREARRLGCARLAGFFYRTREEAEAYCRKFQLKVSAIMVERNLNGGQP